MNLHGIVAPIVGAVNPLIPVTVQVSIGPGPTAPNGDRAPLYATPGSFTGSIAGTVLTVTAIAAGRLQAGQTLADDPVTLLPGTALTSQLSGSPGGIGTYAVNRSQTVAQEAMTTTLVLPGQVQPITWRDLQQMDGLNLNGSRVKVYLYGQIDAIVRSQDKGGDLITIAGGVNAGVYLVAQTLEQFPDWCSVACTLQNGA